MNHRQFLGENKMPKTNKPVKVKHSFGIEQTDLDEFTRRAEELDTNPSALARLLIRAFNAGLIKLPRNEAIDRSYQ